MFINLNAGRLLRQNIATNGNGSLDKYGIAKINFAIERFFVIAYPIHPITFYATVLVIVYSSIYLSLL